MTTKTTLKANAPTGPQGWLLPAATPGIANGVRVAMIALMPVLIVMTVVRVLLSPAYTGWAYYHPDFPPDVVGVWSADDRMLFADYARIYIKNGSLPLEFLAGTPFPDKPYNERELGHMLDVQIVTVWALRLWWVSLVVVIGGGLWLGLPVSTRRYARSALMIGSGIVMAVLLSLLGFIFVDFDTFFTQFHNVLFDPGTWVFYIDDNLIRMFPLKFWNDIFIILASASFGMAAIIFGLAAVVLRPPTKG